MSTQAYIRLCAHAPVCLYAYTLKAGQTCKYLNLTYGNSIKLGALILKKRFMHIDSLLIAPKFDNTKACFSEVV